MRLIDADKLPYVNKVILVDKSDGDVIITIAKEYTSYVNDETPTVEAIPIEWIEMFVQKYKFCGDEEYKLFHFMIAQWKKWEKENEISVMPVSDNSTIPLDYLGERK